MSALAAPGVLAWLLTLAAVALHPLLRAEAWLPGRDLLLVVLLLLAAIGFVTRALRPPYGGRIAAWLVAAGALVALAGVGLDQVRGLRGSVTLAVGQMSNNFDEAGTDGRSLGLRPFGFQVGLQAMTPAGAVLVLPDGRTTVLAPGRTAAIGGFRLADARASATGGVARLRVAAADGQKTEVADVVPGQPARAGNLVLSLEQYFPDFALDDRQQPFTRSLEPRNPAALLSVRRDGRTYRAFVIQSMPGAHRVEPLGVAFSLLDVEPEQSVTIAVHHQPFALIALLGALLLAGGVAVGVVRPASTAVGESKDDLLVAGAGLLTGLWLADSGQILRWTFAVPSAGVRSPLEGAGVLLGLALLATLGGVLLLGAGRLAPGTDVRAVARGALSGAVIAGAVAVALAALRLALLPSGVETAAVLPVAGVALGTAVLAAALSPLTQETLAAPATTAVAAALLLAAVAVVGIQANAAHGAYAVAATSAAAATALLGLAAREETGLVSLRRLALLVAVLALLVL